MERNEQVQRDMPSSDLALKRTPYIRERMTACRSMLWCNTQIPKCNHRVNSQTRENTFSTFQNFTISRTSHSASFWKRGETKREWPFMWGCRSLLCRRQLLKHNPWGVWGREEEKKTCGGVVELPSLSLPVLSPCSHSFSKTGQWCLRRRLEL